ncbi:MAG: MFS transporter [Deltaproteobacteria bacterium]|jgi:MFS family permease|nr:MFS transporter [Deltaproteobacteria bacterium]
MASKVDNKPKAPNEDALWTKGYLTFVFLNLFNFMGFYMLLSTLSVYLSQNGCSGSEIGLIVGSFVVASIATRLLSVPLAKHFGAVRVVRGGLIVLSIGTLFFFLIKAMPSYMAARILEGAGFGVTSTLILSMVAQIIPPKRMAEGLGYIGLGNTVSMAIGPLLGLFLANEFGFEFMFTVMAGFGMLSAAITLLIPNKNLFAYQEAKKPEAPRRWHLDWRPIAPAALAIFYGVAVSSVTTYMAVYASNEHLPSAALFFLTSTIGTLFSRVFSGKLYDRHGHMAVIPLAAATLIISFLLLVKAATGGSHFAYFLASILYGLGIGATFPSIQTLTLSSVPSAKRTISAVTFYVCFDLGSGSGSFILGSVAQIFGDYTYVFLAAAISMGLYILFYSYFFVWPKKRHAFEEAAKRP